MGGPHVDRMGVGDDILSNGKIGCTMENGEKIMFSDHLLESHIVMSHPEHVFEVGDHVEARTLASQGRWLPAVIQKHNLGAYDYGVEYDTGHAQGKVYGSNEVRNIPEIPYKEGERVDLYNKEDRWAPARLVKKNVTHFLVRTLYDHSVDNIDEWILNSHCWKRIQPAGMKTGDVKSEIKWTVGGNWNAYITWHGRQFFLGSYPRKAGAAEVIALARQAKKENRLKKFYYENLASETWKYKKPYQWHPGEVCGW